MEAIDNVKSMIEDFKDKERLRPIEAQRLYKGISDMVKSFDVTPESGDFKMFLQTLKDGSDLMMTKYVDPLIGVLG